MRGEDEEDAFGVFLLDHRGGGGDRRRGVAGHGLEEDGAQRAAPAPCLLCGNESMFLVADQDGPGGFRMGVTARQCVLQQGLFADQ